MMAELDDDIVRAKLGAIEQARRHLAGLGDIDGNRLRSEPVIAAAAERFLCRMVELAVDTNSHISATVLARAPGSYRESFDFIREAGALTLETTDAIKPSVGLRNAIVHEYLDVDYDIVAASIPMALRLYDDYVREVAAFVLDRAS